jgi:hypothetical protein
MRPTPLFLTAALAACTSSPDSGQSTPNGLQMNDLSVLLPLPHTQADYDAMLAPTTTARDGVLLPETIYDSAGGFLSYQDLRAVAFRIDPCFGQLGPVTDPTQCHAQLRIVFQPVFFSGSGDDGSATVEDGGVHVFYALTEGELRAIVNDIVDARVADGVTTDLGPLAVHPTIAREGTAGALATAYDAILARYASPDTMIRMTEFVIELPELAPQIVSSSNTEFWDFESFDIAAGSATPRDIATMPSTDVTSTMSISGGTAPLVASASPLTTSVDNIAVLEDMNQATAATVTARQAAFDAALRVQNPAKNSPDTIDCASCHLAGPAIDLVASTFSMSAVGDTNAFVAWPTIPTADLARTTPLQGDGSVPLNIHAFSYLLAQPMINQRVINETAANLAYIDTL